MTSRSWLSAISLPDNVELLCGEDAYAFEQLRANALKLFLDNNFELVMPPLLEREQSDRGPLGDDLKDMMFVTQDPTTGDVLRVRADLTAQTAYLDACSERYSGKGVARMCYALPALHARARHLLSTREPWYAGVECYGSTKFESDMEVLALSIACARLACSGKLYLSVGHAAIFPALADAARLSEEQRSALRDATERKSAEDVRTVIEGVGDKKAQPYLSMLSALTGLYGGAEVLKEAQKVFAGAGKEVKDALATLSTTLAHVAKKHKDVEVHIDLGDVAGFRYHTGLVFSLYAEGCGEALAYGGRCDGVGERYGRARPAVGFSADLRLLAAIQRDKS